MIKDMISIIVPAYNVESYVKKTIESILKQTYTNIEVICVDDGSKDNTFQRLKFIAASDKRARVFTKENEGVTKAREFGYEQAQGEYFGFVDADDIVEPDMFERLYQNMKKYDTDISHCGYVVDKLDGGKEYFYNTGRLAKQDTAEGVKALLHGSFEPGLCNKLYNHNLLHSLFHSGVMDYSIKMNEDVLMNYYLFKEARSSVLEDVCLYHYVKREGSATMSTYNRKETWDRLNVKKIIYDDAVGTDYEIDAKVVFLEKIIHSYNVFLNQQSPEYESDKQQVRQMLIEHKSDIQYLNKKYKLLTKTLLFSPKLYSLVHKVFS